MLEGDGVVVDPAVGGRRLDHRVLAAHVVGGERHVDSAAGGGDDVEVGERRLDHHDVGALGDVGVDLAQRLAAVAPVLLVALAVAAADDRHVDGVAERPVQGAGVLRRVGEDRHVGEPVAVEGGADAADLAVHHPARRDDVRRRPWPGPRAALA